MGGLSLVAILLPCLVGATVVAIQRAAPKTEAEHARRWCQGGELEHRLEDGRRVDCLVGVHAVEVEFSDKWAEGVGQALSYALATSRRPGLVLIPRGAACQHRRHVLELRARYSLPLDVWMLGGESC